MAPPLLQHEARAAAGLPPTPTPSYVAPCDAACTIEPDAAIASAWAWAPPPRVTVRVDAVKQLVPVHVLALVVVTLRRQGPAWAAPERTATATIAMRKRISTSVGNKKRSIEPTH